MKIVSTVPSQTELLADLGLENEVVGITKFCVHPESWYRNKLRIGGTKNLDLKKIRTLQPDLIIANKEENTKDQIEALMKDFKVFVSDVKTLTDNFALIEKVGELTNRQLESIQLRHKLKTAIKTVYSTKRRKAAYLIWKDPIMVAGGDTFINSMLELCGFQNIFKDRTRYPEVAIEDIFTLEPEYILLSSEPFPFKEKHVKEYQDIFTDSKVMTVDGEAFSWYGTRVIKKEDYLKRLTQGLFS